MTVIQPEDFVILENEFTDFEVPALEDNVDVDTMIKDIVSVRYNSLIIEYT